MEVEGEAGFREALYRRAAERVAGMAQDAAAAWLAGHGLLSMASWEGLAGGVRERLRERGRRTAAYNLFLVSRFREAVAALEGIPVCALKGIHLLDAVYRDDPGSRALADVDLLVPADRMEEAIERLAAALGLEEEPLSRRVRRVSPERILAGRSFALELHERLGYKHGWASAWEDVAPVPERVHGCPVHVLDRETALVHLVTHLVKHRPFSRLVWAEDVVRWAEGGADGGRAVAVARRMGGLRSFVAGVRALRSLVGEGFLPGVPATVGGLGGRLLLANERWLWADLRGGRLPAPAASATGRDRPTGGRAVVSALLLADRPADALRVVGVKAAEVLLRGSAGM